MSADLNQKCLLFLNTASHLKYYQFEALPFWSDDQMTIALCGEDQRAELTPEIANRFNHVFFAPNEIINGFPSITFEKLPSELLSLLDEWSQQGRSVSVISSVNEYAYVASQLRDRFNAFGRNTKEIENYWNKSASKHCLAQAGLRFPHFTSHLIAELRLDPEKRFRQLSEKLGLPFIAKPQESAGSIGVHKIHNCKEFSHWLSSDLICERFDFEEYIEGKLFHVDSLVQNGRRRHHFCFEYAYPNLDFMSGSPLGSVSLDPDSEIAQRLTEFSMDVLSALGLNDGSSHMEIFENKKGELVFLEIGPRPPGMVTMDCYASVHGINFLNLDACISTQTKVPTPASSKRFGFWMFWPRFDGEVSEFRLPKVKNHFEFNPLVSVGAVTHRSKFLRDQSCEIQVWGEDFDSVYQDFCTLRDLSTPPVIMKQKSATAAH